MDQTRKELAGQAFAKSELTTISTLPSLCGQTASEADMQRIGQDVNQSQTVTVQLLPHNDESSSDMTSQTKQPTRRLAPRKCD